MGSTNVLIARVIKLKGALCNFLQAYKQQTRANMSFKCAFKPYVYECKTHHITHLDVLQFKNITLGYLTKIVTKKLHNAPLNGNI